jgi:hypothetical protein
VAERAVNVRVTSSLDPEHVLGVSLSQAQVDVVLEALQIAKRLARGERS